MRTEKLDNVMVITPKGGHLDASNREEFRASLEAAAADAATAGIKSLILDLMNVRFVDSSGLGVIMTALRRIREADGDMVACNIMKPVKILFDLVRLDRVMSVYGDRATAIASYSSGNGEASETVRPDAGA